MMLLYLSVTVSDLDSLILTNTLACDTQQGRNNEVHWPQLAEISLSELKLLRQNRHLSLYNLIVP